MPEVDSIRAELKALLNAETFSPFTLTFTNGTTLPVPRPDILWLPEGSAMFCYLDDHGGVRVIAYRHVVSAEVANAA